MAKISRFAMTRIAASLNADLIADENVKDSFYLDGRIARKRESRGADITSAGEDRGFFYAIFATHDLNIDSPDSETISTLHNLTEAIKTSNDKIDNEINDLADCAVEVGGRATIAREGVRQSYFAGIIIKEAEIAAVTTGGACTFLYRNNAIYPLTGCDVDLVNADYHGNAIENMNDFSAGVAGTIRYSNIAQLQTGDALILCNKEILEAIGQRELLNVLYNYADGGDAAAEMIDRARAKNQDQPLQVLIAVVEDVIPADRTSKINLGLFQAQKDLSEQETTRYEPIKTASTVSSDHKVSGTKSKDDILETQINQDEDDPFKPSYFPTSKSTASDNVEDIDYEDVDFTDLEELPVSKVESSQENLPVFSQEADDGVPVFEPIVKSEHDYESDAFTAGRKYADDDYYDMEDEDDEDSYGDEWQDDRSVLTGNRNQDYDDYDYDDYDVYGERETDGSKTKQYVLYIILGIVCIACLVALYFMLFKNDDADTDQNATDPNGTAQVDISDPDQDDSTQSTEESDIRTPVQSGTDQASTDPTDSGGVDENGSIVVGSTVYVTADALNMRSEPNAESDIITQLPLGDALTVVEIDDGWYSVTTSDGTAGYVSADYVSTTAP